MAKLVEGNNEFAFDLYRQLSKREGNIIFSPYSISTALAMTYGGARGETAAMLQKGMEKIRPHHGSVALPRFKATLRFSLADDLRQMGMPLAFSPDADFLGIAVGKSLRTSKVVHKAFIDVDEKGTEAAAATALSHDLAKAPPFCFRANRPFLFLIRDVRTSSILFLGRVSDPRS